MIEDARDAVDLVVLGGGDGTMNTAAEVLARTGMPLGVLPLGAANDLADSLGVGNSLDRACDALVNGETVRINAGVVNGKYYFNTAHVGMSVDMVERLSDDEKKRLGFLSYILKMTRTYWESEAFSAAIECDGHTYETEAMEIAVANGVKYGGGLVSARDASMTDDTLYCYVIQPQPVVQLALKIPAFYAGTLEGKRNVLFLRGRNIRVETGDKRKIMADGEIIGATPGEFGFAAKAVTVYAPKGYGDDRKEGPMFRDDRAVALDEAAVAVRDAQQQYEHFANFVEDGGNEAFFRRLAESRRGLADELEEAVRENDELPMSPDPDREALEEFLNWIRSTLADQKAAVLLDKAAELEGLIASAANRAAGFDQPGKIAEVLEKAGEEARRAGAEIEERRDAEGKG
jgi:YegS/Rv2252/BmrU family lipid kinase